MLKAFSRLAQTFTLALLLVISSGAAYAQDVTVSIADIAQRVGTSVSVPVNVSGVAANVNSFDFTVNTDPGITYTGFTRAGSLTAGAEWAGVLTSVATGVVTGFAAGTPITTSGTLIFLNFDLGATDAVGTVTLTGFGLNSGTPSATVAPDFDFIAATRLLSASDHTVNVNDTFTASVSADDALVAGDNVNTLDFTLSYDPAQVDVVGGNDGVTVGATATGWSVQANDNGTGTITVSSFGPTLTGTGELFKVALTSVAAGTSSLALSGVTFSPGTPSYGLKAGTVVATANAVPVSVAGTLSTNEDTAGTATLSATDADAGDVLTYSIVAQPTNGTVTLAGAVATYTPNANYNGADTFTFTANDGTVDSAAATVSVTVTAVNDAPVAAAAAGTTTEDVAGTVTLSATDVDGNALTYTAGTATNGTVVVAGTTATYTPNANFNGTDSFTYTANDGTVDSAPATVSMTVTAVNDAPVAAAAAGTTTEDVAGTVTLSATDVEGSTLTYTAGTAANGTVVVAGTTATYTPNANFNGTDTFTYTANDGTVDSAPATATVTVTAVNDAPTANAAIASTTEGASIAVTLSGADIDGDALTFAASNGSNGTVSVTGTSATYSPNAGFSGTDTFTYTANDGTVSSATATVTVTVTAVNDAPVAAGIGAVTNEDTAVAVTFSATDADGDAVTFAVATQPTSGTVAVVGSTATYTPNADANGTDTFTYTANDGTVDSAPATVTITVNAVNDLPVAANATGSTAEDTAVDVTLSATDVDGDALTYVASAPANGSVTVAGTTATYTPNANFNGTDTFTYVANDGTANSASATATVTVGSVNDVPVAANATLAIDEDNSGEVTLAATDNDSDALTFTIGDPTSGTATLDGTKVTYTPNANFNGTDSFTFTANDGTVDSAPATVSVTVAAVNDAPVFTAQLATTAVSEDSGIINFVYAATDADGDALTFTMTAGPFSATLDGTSGAFSFNPLGNAGNYPVTVSVSDGTVTVASTSATISVYAVNTIVSPLSGVHQVGPVASPGNGTVAVRLVEGTNTLEVSGTFKDLSSAYSASHIHMAGVGKVGGVAIPLVATVATGGRSGSWTLAQNTFDLSTITYPTGVTKASFIAALQAGSAYVNVHSAAHASGEIRGQLLGTTNAAPSVTTALSPASVVVAGSPSASLIPISWVPASDPDGNPVQYLFEMSSEASFASHIMFENMGVTNGFLLSVAQAASIYDEASNSAPGSVSVGGTIKVYMRVTTTDGSLWSIGATSEMQLTRGLVTANEVDAELPTEFTLRGNYPNPFNPSTTIQFDLPQTADVNIIVVDLLGRQVLSVPTATIDAGSSKTIQVDASSLSSGVYMYRLVANMQNGVQVRVGTMTLIK